MSAAAVLAPEIPEPLTWAEICARHPDEWVCLVELDQLHPNGFAFRTARVVGHGKTRRAPVDQAMAWRSSYELIGHFYTGRVTARPPRPTLVLDDETRDAIRTRR
jgi:hypothetical protein